MIKALLSLLFAVSLSAQIITFPVPIITVPPGGALYPAADYLCANAADTTPVGGCSGHVATTDTNFATNFTIPANTLVAGKTLRLTLVWTFTSSAAPATVLFKLKLGSTVIYSSPAASPGTSLVTDQGGIATLIIGTAAPGASVPVLTAYTSPGIGGSQRNSLSQPVNVATNAAQPLSVSITFGAGTAGNYMILKAFLVEWMN